ncbi:hypothetical protein D9M69_719840 [compost metagenome]
MPDKIRNRRVLVNLDALLQACPAQFAHHLCRVEQRVVGLEEPCGIAGRVEVGLERVALQVLAIDAEALVLLPLGLETFNLPRGRRDGELAFPFELRVQAESLDVPL